MTDNSSDVKVFARFRPLNPREQQFYNQPNIKNTQNTQPIYNFKNESNTTIEIQIPTAKEQLTEIKTKEFSFDHIFPETSTQPEIYQHVAQPLLNDILKGFNCTIIAYGQTGSGKSYTMMGDTTNHETNQTYGIIPRTVQELFQRIQEKKDTTLFTIQCSYVEIYLEKVRDLLNPTLDNLKLREVVIENKSTKNKKNEKSYIYIEGCTLCTVKNLQEIMKVMKHGENNRVTATTEMNDRSSRSHAVFILNITQTDIIRQTRKSSKLFLVDLAGSEQVSRSGATGLTLEQAKKINKSLSTLSLVIQTLTEKKGKDPHIPYRDSKLTRLLTDSLGGNSKTVLIIALSPSRDSLWETYSTLGFGARAKKIQNHARINEEISPETYKKLIQTLTEEVELYKTKYSLVQNEYQILLAKYNALHQTQISETETPLESKESQSARDTNDTENKKIFKPSQPFQKISNPEFDTNSSISSRSSRRPSQSRSISQIFNSHDLNLSDQDDIIRVAVESIDPQEEKSESSQKPETPKNTTKESTPKNNNTPSTPSILDDLSMFQTGNLVVWGMDNIFTFEKF
jgi:kinesin family protein 5